MKETKHREKAFMAKFEDQYLAIDSSSSSTLSSSDQKVVIRKGGKKDARTSWTLLHGYKPQAEEPPKHQES